MNLFGLLRGRRNDKNGLGGATPDLDQNHAAKTDDAGAPSVPPTDYPLPPVNYPQWWREAVGGGARFRLDMDDLFSGYQFGEPWVHARLVEAATGGEPFDQIAEVPYRRGLGVILCRDGWSIAQQGNYDVLFVGYGDIMDFMTSGKMVPREPGTLGWGKPVDTEGWQYESPDGVLLPYQRLALAEALRAWGVSDPRMTLVIDRHGTRSLVANLNAMLGDRNRAMDMSGLVNYYLPKYYYQLVIENDENIAVFPLLPSAEGGADGLARAVEAADAQRRAVLEGRTAEDEPAVDDATSEGGSAEAIPEESPQKQQWRQVALSPLARFRFDPAVVYDVDGVPFTMVHPAEAGSANVYSFRMMVLGLADRGTGVILCHSNWDPNGSDSDCLMLNLGDIVDFLMRGHLEPLRLGSDGWGATKDLRGGTFTEPDPHVLPLQCRSSIQSAMTRAGVDEPRVALYTNRFGERSLHFSGWGAVLTGDGGMQAVRSLSRAISRCLPSHYVSVMDQPKATVSALRTRWGLWPSGAYEALVEG